MKRRMFIWLALIVSCMTPALPQQSRYSDVANLPFQQSYPTDETARRLKDELLFQRGVQSYLWALPAINMWAMKGW